MVYLLGLGLSKLEGILHHQEIINASGNKSGGKLLKILNEKSYREAVSYYLATQATIRILGIYKDMIWKAPDLRKLKTLD